MGGRWATDDEWAWLVSMIPQYLEAVAEGQKQAFLDQAHTDFLEKFTPSPTPAQVAALGREEAEKAIATAYEAVSVWFFSSLKFNLT